MIIAGFLVLLALVGSWFYFDKLISTKNHSDKPEAVIEIKEGTPSLEVARELERLGAVKSARAFFVYTKISGKMIRAGMYTLVYNLSVKELAAKLSDGEYLLTKITIPEGKRIEQIAAMLEDKKYFAYKDIVDAAAKQEGRLFPDTYYVSKQTTAVEFVKMMQDNFYKKTNTLNLTEEQLVLASIVERESIKDEERALVAGIFMNRLNIDMKLESDPTVLYVHDTEHTKSISAYSATQYAFWQPISFSEYKTFDSTYNTYLYKGLPPAPICSPGLASIQAAQNPQQSDYLFFLHDANGQIYPAKTNEEHEANKDKYL